MQNHLTLSQLQKLVKATLDEAFALPVWVSAEIAEIKINYSGHCYLELVEKGGDNGVPLSQARAVIWRTAYARIAGYFEAETGQRLAAGIRILARVMISYHELYGFSLNILDIDPTFTLGDMERQRQITIERLQREGVWDINRENPLPQVVQRIAIVSSRQAAGYQDFCKELGKSPYAFSLTLFDAVADRMDDFDAVVLIRGGGSASDLNCFNAYRLCAHIAQFPLPILTGIGHDKDTSVADMVAHTALKTPTAVAGWLVERMTGVEGWLDTAALQLRDASAGIFRRHELRLAELGSEIAHQSALLLLRRNEQLSRWSDELSTAVGELLRRQHTRLTTAEELIASRSPEHILSLGFAIVHRGDETVTSAKGLSSGDTLRVELSDGTFDATVK
jgi:exodeoxyribonuclease VII large subunit